MLISKNLSTGYGAELASRSKVIFSGYTTCQPDIPSTLYDYVIEVENTFLKVQVKGSNPREDGLIKADVRRSHTKYRGRTYNRNSFDIISIVNELTGEVCFIDYASLGCPTQVSIRTVSPENLSGFGGNQKLRLFREHEDVDLAIESVMTRLREVS